MVGETKGTISTGSDIFLKNKLEIVHRRVIKYFKYIRFKTTYLPKNRYPHNNGTNQCWAGT
jgi:hypothetical protein